MDIKKYLTEKKALVDKTLEEYFAKERDFPPALKEAVFYSLRAGGKRVRPILTIASAEACGGKAENVLAICAALEMIHTFSLIHDDLPAMDNDDLRRGLPTSHKKFGEAAAILAGDALLAEAFSCLAASFGRQNLIEIIRDIAEATGARGMTGG
ncbi:MAG: polyprenyl synthetase family protein, partial [Deltaproteobacteria bacterium]|nr:polyprenyl synthetase family protein [Deltaproteobacteria bacterium]